MTNSVSPSDDDSTESLDSVLVEFSDIHIHSTPRPLRDVVLRHLHTWLREAAEKRRHPSLKEHDLSSLAHCLLEQARALIPAQRYTEGIPKVAEAEELFREHEIRYGLADCYHVAAELHRGLGEIDKALDYLRKEEEIRRSLAA